MTIAGSLEVITADGTNRGLDVAAATDVDIPVLLRAVYGLDGATQDTLPADPPATLAAVWTAQDPIGQAVTINVWQDPAQEITP